MMTITSPSNPRVKDLARLNTQASMRRELGLFCVESARELDRAIAGGFEVRELWYDPQAGSPPRIAGDVPIVQASAAVIQKIAYRENPQGFVAVLQARPADLKSLAPADSALILVASGLEKPGNVGAILRSAAAAGADAVVIDSPKFDLYNPNTIRASTGAIFSLPVVCDEPAAVAAWLEARNILPIAATPDATLTMGMVNLRRSVALIVGSEDQGLDSFWLDASPIHVAIRMAKGAVDSLNVSVTAALLLFEAARQRSG